MIIPPQRHWILLVVHPWDFGAEWIHDRKLTTTTVIKIKTCAASMIFPSKTPMSCRKKNKLRWYPQQPQRFIVTNLSEACCEAKRWNLLRTLLNLTWLHQSLPAQTFSGNLLRNRNPVEPHLAAPKAPRPSPELSPEPCRTWPGSAPKPPGTFSGTFSGTLLNLAWLHFPTPPHTTQWPKGTNQRGKGTEVRDWRERVGWAGVMGGPFGSLFSPFTTHHATARRSFLTSWARRVANEVKSEGREHQSLPELLRNLLPNPVEPDWVCTKAFQTFSGAFSGALLNLTWLWTKASQTFSGSFGTFSGTSLNLTRRLHLCSPELFWAENPISLRCWGKKHLEILESACMDVYVGGVTGLTELHCQLANILIRAHRLLRRSAHIRFVYALLSVTCSGGGWGGWGR